MFQKEMYLYVKLLCLHAKKIHVFSFWGFVGGFSGKKKKKQNLRDKIWCFFVEMQLP